jgi:hypothetical protein
MRLGIWVTIHEWFWFQIMSTVYDISLNGFVFLLT